MIRSFIISIIRGPEPTIYQAQRLRSLCRAIAAEGGIVTDCNPILEIYEDVILMAERRGLIGSGSGWSAQIYLKNNGYTAAQTGDV